MNHVVKEMPQTATDPRGHHRETVKLTQANLPLFTAATRPNYDRSALTAGIVHIGLGNFHRAHQAWYLHRLMQQGLAHDWAIVGAGVRPNDQQMKEKLHAQDYLTTLIELSPQSQSAEIIGSMIDFIDVTEDNATLIAQLSDPAIRIVSLTVTEGGYYIDVAGDDVDMAHPDIQHDIAHPDQPKTAFGAIIAALKNRRDAGIAAFTCQSCDNLQGNGNVLRRTVLTLADAIDPTLARWIEQNSSFPNSMVDSIVPATGNNEIQLAQSLGIDDNVPVTHENFRQWVIEDDFCNGRPPWESVGVTFTPDVHAYETMKIRLLNGGHQIIAAAGDLLGIKTIADAINHPLIGQLFDHVEHNEILPHVAAVPDYTPHAYIQLVKQRFANTAIIDTTRRVAFDGSSRQSGFILPSVTDCLDKGINPNGLALVSAIWARYCLGIREDGSVIENNDPHWEALQALAHVAKTDPIQWIANRSIYGDLAQHRAFAEPFTTWLLRLNDVGLATTLQEFIATS